MSEKTENKDTNEDTPVVVEQPAVVNDFYSNDSGVVFGIEEIVEANELDDLSGMQVPVNQDGIRSIVPIVHAIPGTIDGRENMIGEEVKTRLMGQFTSLQVWLDKSDVESVHGFAEDGDESNEKKRLSIPLRYVFRTDFKSRTDAGALVDNDPIAWWYANYERLSQLQTVAISDNYGESKKIKTDKAITKWVYIPVLDVATGAEMYLYMKDWHFKKLVPIIRSFMNNFYGHMFEFSVKNAGTTKVEYQLLAKNKAYTEDNLPEYPTKININDFDTFGIPVSDLEARVEFLTRLGLEEHFPATASWS